MAAVKVNSLDEIPPTLTAKQIPAGTYIDYRFSGTYQAAMDYLYQTYLSKSDRHPAYPLDIEVVGDDWQRINLEDTVRRILIPINDSVNDI